MLSSSHLPSPPSQRRTGGNCKRRRFDSGGSRGKVSCRVNLWRVGSRGQAEFQLQNSTAKESKAAVGYQIKNGLDLTRVSSKATIKHGPPGAGTGIIQKGTRGKASVLVNGGCCCSLDRRY